MAQQHSRQFPELQLHFRNVLMAKAGPRAHAPIAKSMT
jgi:hypothetical protein